MLPSSARGVEEDWMYREKAVEAMQEGEKKDIVFLSYDKAGKINGPQAWVGNLSLRLKEEGISVGVLILRKKKEKGELEKRLEAQGVPFLSVEKKGNHLGRAEWICERLAELTPRVFVAQNIPEGMTACHLLADSPMERVMVIHSDDPHHRRLAECYLQEGCRGVTRVVCVSSHLLEKGKERFPGGSWVFDLCSCGAELPPFKGARVGGEELRMLYCGRIEEVAKRALAVVRASAMACHQIPGVTAEFAGEGSMTGEAKRLAASLPGGDKIRFHGLLDGAGMKKVLSSCDTFILLSDYEGMPMGLMEAMAHGLVPVVTRMESGIPELVVDRETGLIVRDREKDFVRAVRELKEDPELREALSKGARELIKSKYSMEIVSGYWKNLVNRSSPHDPARPLLKKAMPPGLWKYPWGDRSVSRGMVGTVLSILFRATWNRWIAIPPSTRSSWRRKARSFLGKG